MSAQEEYERSTFTLAAMGNELLDVDGNHIRLGAPVHYIEDHRTEDDPDNVWNPDRWGIASGFARTDRLREGSTEHDVSVRVSHVDISDGDRSSWNNSEFFCDPKRLRVLT